MPDFNKYVGLPWEFKGRGDGGVDCWGLVRKFYKDEFGIVLPVYSDVCYVGDHKEIIPGAKRIVENETSLSFVQVQTPAPGDIILINVFGAPIHVGIVVDKRRFLHIRENTGSEIVRDWKWRNKIEGYYRHSSLMGQ